jgi:hypothetical protein
MKRAGKWFVVGRWWIRIWPFSVTANTDGWKILEGDRWERFIDLLRSNPLYLVGLKKYGKYT